MNSEQDSGLFPIIMILVGLAAIRYIWRFKRNKNKRLERKRVNDYKEIGPYPVAVLKDKLRQAQYKLIDKTREALSFNWFPSDFISGPAFRFQNNGHAVSGGARDLARRTIYTAIRSIGAEVYEISPAKQSDPDAYVHRHYAPSDLARAFSNDEITDNHIIVGIDIDYYLTDINEWIGVGNPLIFYTFNPTAVSGMDGDSHFRIEGEDVEYDVNGGNRWSHKVWDWCAFGEFVMAKKIPRNSKERWAQWWWSWFGMEQVVYSKICYTRPFKNNKHRVLVHVIPEATHWQYKHIDTDMHARSLERIDYSDEFREGWNKLVYVGDDNNLYVSIGRAGADLSVELPKNHYDLLIGLNTPQSVSSRMIGLGYKDTTIMALVGQYIKGGELEIDPVVRLGREHELRVHWPTISEIDTPVVSYRPYSNPLVGSSNFVPQIKRWEATSLSIDKRITFHKNVKTPGPSIEKYAAEFIKILVPIPGIGAPMSYSAVEKELTKPAQVLALRSIADSLDVPARKLIESFIKNEPCMKPGRMISAFADFRFIAQLSRFTLCFRNEVLHDEDNTHWFMPGRTPKQIAESVREYVSTVDEPVEGDFSNFDGTVSEWCQRVVMNAAYLRYFNKQYREELSPLLEQLINCPARSKVFGFRYEAGVGVKSGSPTTCDANTILNAFMMYCAVRRSKPDVPPELAYKMIGLAFGDDQVFDWQYRTSLQKVVDRIGMKIKMERYQPDQGLCFLARVFIDPYTTTSSIQDPLRTWRKLHLTSRHIGIPVEEAAYDRVQGYLVTDGITPVTSNYCRAVQRIYGPKCDHKKRLSRKSIDKEKPYWYIHGDGSWPQQPQDVPLMWSIIANRTGFTKLQLQNVAKELDDLTDVWSSPTLGGHEEIYTTDGTIGTEGEVAVEEMDQRFMEETTNNVRQRANPNNYRERPGDSRTAGSSSERPSNHRTNQNEPRPNVIRHELKQRDQETDRQHQLPPVQARTVGLARQAGSQVRARSDRRRSPQPSGTSQGNDGQDPKVQRRRGGRGHGGNRKNTSRGSPEATGK